MPAYVNAIANTPAAGPRPTTLTKTRAHTISGILRIKINMIRIACRITNGKVDMRPVNAEMDSTRVLNKVSGIANTRAKTIPAVAIAIVRQASIATNFRKSDLVLGGTKSAKNLRVTLRFSASKKNPRLKFC